jgi:hypothetical protein
MLWNLLPLLFSPYQIEILSEQATEPILTEGGRQERKLQLELDQDITILEQQKLSQKPIRKNW